MSECCKSQGTFLGVQDVMCELHCGRSKALLIMQEVGAERVGRTLLLRRDVLEEHMRANGGVKVTWPTRKRSDCRI